MTTSIWDKLESSSKPREQMLLTDAKQWLAEVVPASKRQWFEGRLRGPNHAFLSALLELFCHHHLSDKGYAIEWDPSMPSTGKAPEFRATSEGQPLLLEARFSGQEHELTAQEDTNRLVQAALEELDLPYVISFQWDGPPPPISAIEQTISAISDRVQKAANDSETGSLGGSMSLHGQTYRFSIEITPGEPEGLVLPMATWVGRPGDKVYQDIEEKVHRYGKPSEPFVIVVWPHGPSANGEAVKSALYGTLMGAINPSTSSIQWGRAHDGIFSVETDGQPSAAHVSAVGVYQQESVGDRVAHRFRLYHNPQSVYPLPESTFEDYPQFVRRDDTMVWIPENPDR